MATRGAAGKQAKPQVDGGLCGACEEISRVDEQVRTVDAQRPANKPSGVEPEPTSGPTRRAHRTVLLGQFSAELAWIETPRRGLKSPDEASTTLVDWIEESLRRPPRSGSARISRDEEELHVQKCAECC